MAVLAAQMAQQGLILYFQRSLLLVVGLAHTTRGLLALGVLEAEQVEEIQPQVEQETHQAHLLRRAIMEVLVGVAVMVLVLEEAGLLR